MTTTPNRTDVLGDLRGAFDCLVTWAKEAAERRGLPAPAPITKFPAAPGGTPLSSVIAATMAALVACIRLTDSMLLSSTHVGALSSSYVRNALRDMCKGFAGVELVIPIAPSLAEEAESALQYVNTLCIIVRRLCVGAVPIADNRLIPLELSAVKHLVCRVSYTPFVQPRATGHDIDDYIVEMHRECMRASAAIGSHLAQSTTVSVVADMCQRRASPTVPKRDVSPLVDTAAVLEDSEDDADM
jgi:hypothetical protein